MESCAFVEAYRSGFDRTVHFLLSRGAHRESAREAAQAAWVRGWERLNQLRNEEFVFTWVNAIALNFYRALIRREMQCDPLVDMRSQFTMNLAALDVDQLLKFCLPQERLLFEQQICGFTTDEMARQQGVTRTAIRIRLLRARRAARSRMEAHANQRRELCARSTATV